MPVAPVFRSPGDALHLLAAALHLVWACRKTSMPLRRLPTIILALSPFLALGVITAVLALHATPRVVQERAAVEITAPI